MSSVPPDDVSPAPDWRGSRSGDPSREPSHRWQQARQTQPTSRTTAWPHRLRVLALVVCFVAQLGLFVYWLDIQQRRTAVIVAVAPPYEWPMPVNGWAEEDVDRLARLDGLTIDLTDVSDDARTRDSLSTVLARTVEREVARLRREGAIVVYLSVHGVVDGRGEPCLAPPGASPYDSSTWLPVREVIREIGKQSLPKRSTVLLVLDCNRVLVDWDLGQFDGSFSDRVRVVADDERVPGLALMTAAGTGERSWASPSLGGSPFGRYFFEGLAGAADSELDGDRDRQVSVDELHAYVQTHVSAWARSNRDASQSPQLIAPTAGDGGVSWPLEEQEWKSLEAADGEPTLPVSADEVAGLWTVVAESRAIEPTRFDPVGWSRFRRRVVDLEQMLVAGRQYRQPARRLFERLRSRADAVRRAVDSTKSGQPLPLSTEWSLFPHTGSPLPAERAAATLRMAERLGLFADPTVTTRIRAAIDQRVGATDLQSTAKAVSAAGGVRFAEGFDQLQFQRLADWSGVAPRSTAEAVRIRRLANVAALPVDERVLGWITSDVKRADRLRRQAEDALLARRPEKDSWSRAAAAYGEAQKRSDLVAAAYRTRDRAVQDLPPIAEWLSGGSNSEPRSHSEIDTVAAGIRDVTALLSAYDAPATDTLAFASPADKLRETMVGLRGQLVAEYDQLLSRARESVRVDRATAEERTRAGGLVRRARALLDVPLLPEVEGRSVDEMVQQRTELKALVLALDEQLTESPVPSVGRPEPATTPAAAADAYAKGTVHPLLQLLIRLSDRSEDAPRVPGASWEVGEQFRQAMIGVPGEFTTPVFGPNTTRTDFRRRLEDADLLARVTAGFWLPPGADSPVRRRRRLDLQRLETWECERVLTDFWGSNGETAEPYFARVGNDLLDFAKSLAPSPGFSRERIRELERLRDSRLGAAANGLLVSADNAVEIEGSVAADTTVTIAPGEGVRGLPTGLARVVVPGSDGQVLSIPSDLVGRTKQVKFPLATGNLGAFANSVEADVLFRGNRFSTRFAFERVRGLQLVDVPVRSQTSTVLVRSRREERLSVVFVLDCSQSTSQPATLESVSGPATRLDLARLALQRMLGSLEGREQVEVGVAFFGHRVGWQPMKENVLLVNRRYGDVPANLKPYEDVEFVLPLGRFDAAAASLVRGKLEKVRPYGETPLYLALVEALGQFPSAGGESPAGTGGKRAIVVLTDGVNDQFDPPADKDKKLDDALQAFRNSGVEVHVVGLEVESAERERAEKEYGRLARETGGSYENTPATAIAMLGTIERGRGPDVFTLDGNQVPVNSAAKTTVPGQPLTRVVSLDDLSETIVLEGGEGVVLEVNETDRRLELVPYSREPLKLLPLTAPTQAPGTPNDPLSLQFGLHGPFRTPDGLRFEFSWRAGARAFTRRPAAFWIEVVPLLEDGRPYESRYVFYDRRFVEGTANPVAAWTVADWPAKAKSASVTTWCRFDKAPVVETLELVASSTRTTKSIGNLPGTTVEAVVGPGRVLVNEFYGDGTTVPSLAVTTSTSDRIEKITRRFDGKRHVASHEWLFAGGQVPSPVSVRVTSGRPPSDRVWRLSRPWNLSIPGENDVIDLRGPASN